jgi:hypothetical protein
MRAAQVAFIHLKRVLHKGRTSRGCGWPARGSKLGTSLEDMYLEAKHLLLQVRTGGWGWQRGGRAAGASATGGITGLSLASRSTAHWWTTLLYCC